MILGVLRTKISEYDLSRNMWKNFWYLYDHSLQLSVIT